MPKLTAKYIKKKLNAFHQRGDYQGAIDFYVNLHTDATKKSVNDPNNQELKDDEQLIVDSMEELFTDLIQNDEEAGLKYFELLSKNEVDIRLGGVKNYEMYKNRLRTGAIPGTEYMTDDPKTVKKLAFDLMGADLSDPTSARLRANSCMVECISNALAMNHQNNEYIKMLENSQE